MSLFELTIALLKTLRPHNGGGRELRTEDTAGVNGGMGV